MVTSVVGSPSSLARAVIQALSGVLMPKGDDVRIVVSVRGDQLGQRPRPLLAQLWFSWCWNRDPVLGRLGARSQNPSRLVL
jgi:hypothetical protein